MKLEKLKVFNIPGAIRGMRNPMNSWDKSDSVGDILGPEDIKLAQKLINGGSEHRKFMRQIMVCVDITAPLYWWKEFDTYKISVTANSTSTMHKIHSKSITIDDFDIDDYSPDVEGVSENVEMIIGFLESLRSKFVETKDKKYWKELVRWLPESYLQTRTITMNYENLYNIVRQRRGHKLTEWNTFIEYFRKNAIYANDLIFYNY